MHEIEKVSGSGSRARMKLRKSQALAARHALMYKCGNRGVRKHHDPEIDPEIGISERISDL